MKKHERLSDQQRRFIVGELARWVPQEKILAALKAEGSNISRQAIGFYDPTTVLGQGLADKWKELFYAERKRYLDAYEEIAISNRAVRLDALNRMALTAEAKGNFVLAAALHEQAAKEVGEVFTNRRTVDAKVTGFNITVSPEDAAL
jgi:hypothetical protein